MGPPVNWTANAKTMQIVTALPGSATAKLATMATPVNIVRAVPAHTLQQSLDLRDSYLWNIVLWNDPVCSDYFPLFPMLGSFPRVSTWIFWTKLHPAMQLHKQPIMWSCDWALFVPARLHWILLSDKWVGFKFALYWITLYSKTLHIQLRDAVSWYGIERKHYSIYTLRLGGF